MKYLLLFLTLSLSCLVFSESDNPYDLHKNLVIPEIDPEFSKSLKAPIPKAEMTLKDLRQTRKFNAVMKVESPDRKDWGVAKATCSDGGEIGTYILISASLPDDVLRTLFRKYADNSEVQVRVRGLPEGMSLNEYFSYLIDRSIVSKRHPFKGLSIDPRPFDRFGVQEVPALVIATTEGVGIGYGSIDLNWLESMIKEDGYGTYRTPYQTYAIEEKHWVQDMQDRAKKVDWKKHVAKLNKQTWEKFPGEQLPRSLENRTYPLDLSIHVNRDIRGPKGTLIAKSGTVVNPLDDLSIVNTYIAVDPVDTDQVKWLEGYLSNNNHKSIIILLSQLDKEHPKRTYTDVINNYRRKTYALTKDVVGAFKITHLPVVVEQIGADVVVKQFSMGES